MIVKNESDVIQRCLASVKSLIDHWVIVDTGSDDGTQEIIKDYLKDIPGELYERPWVDFAHNRNEAASLAHGKGDYLLFIDADDRLVFSEEFTRPSLEKDVYFIVQKEGDENFLYAENRIVFLIKNDARFEWQGVIHESICFKNETVFAELVSCVYNQYIHDGNRSKDPLRAQKDIALLKKGLLEEPGDLRYLFFLGRAYFDIKDYASALPYLEKRAELAGGPQENYQTLLYIALAHKLLGAEDALIIHSFSGAYLYRPTRAEPLYELAAHLIKKKRFFEAYLVCIHALTLTFPKDILYIEPWVYEWGILLQLFSAASQLHFTCEQARTALSLLIHNPKLPSRVIFDFKLKEAAQTHGVQLCQQSA
jgi:glycosyltransferase involved in cell wall biosynthesis